MNAVVTVSQTNAEAYRASTDAATLCRSIVLETAMEIQGRKYVKVEGWQAIATAHGCTASARSVERVEGGVRAVGEIRRMSDGVVIAEAEGFVGEDEPVWFGGDATNKWGKTTNHVKRPDYAIRAMAQTRAISRAARSAFAHIVVMMNAGLSTTPAEEVPMGGFDDSDGAPAAQNPSRPPSTAPNGVKRLSSARAKEVGLDKKISEAVWGCADAAALAAWDADFDKHTAECPLSWLDSIRNDVILKAEELAGAATADTANAEMDEAYRATVG